jgi:hypothetical protein
MPLEGCKCLEGLTAFAGWCYFVYLNTTIEVDLITTLCLLIREIFNYLPCINLWFFTLGGKHV